MKSRDQVAKSLFSYIISHGKGFHLPLADAVTYLKKYNGNKVGTDGENRNTFS